MGTATQPHMNKSTLPDNLDEVILNILASDNTSTTYRDDFLYNSTGLFSFFLCMYLVIFCVGLMGNLLVCYVVVSTKSMRTVTNYFIFNLALADICLCLFCMLFTPTYYFLYRWLFGKIMCHLVTFTMCTSVYVSTFTLTAIAVDRYIVILYPFRARMTATCCLIIICCIWIFSCVFTIPYALWMYYYSHEGIYYCNEDWPSPTLKKLYGTFTCIMQFAIPLCIISVSYAKVSVKLHDRAKSKPGARSSRREEADRERNKKTNRMLIAMVVIFGVSWMPLTGVNLLYDYHHSASDWKYANLMFFISHLTAMSSTCYNPFLYAWLNENFRKEFKQVLPCFPTQQNIGGRNTIRSRRGDHTVIETAEQNISRNQIEGHIKTVDTVTSALPNDQPVVKYLPESEKVHLLSGNKSDEQTSHITDNGATLMDQNDAAK